MRTAVGNCGLRGILLLGILATPARAQDPAKEPLRITCVAASPVGSRLAIGCSDGSVSIVDAESGACERVLPTEGKFAKLLSFSKNGARLVVGVLDERFPGHGIYASPGAAWAVFDAASGVRKARCPMRRPLDYKLCAKLSPDGSKLLAMSDGLSADVFNAESGTLIVNLHDMEEAISCAEWIGPGDTIVTGGAHGTVRLWRADNAKVVHSTAATNKPIDCLSASPDGTRLVSGSPHVTATVWKLPDLAKQSECSATSGMLFVDVDTIASADWSPSADRIVLSTGTWRSIECRTSKGQLLWMRDFKGGDEAPVHVSFDPSGTRVVSWAMNRTPCFILDARNGETLLDPGSITKLPCCQLDVTGDGRFVASMCGDRVTVVDLQTGTPVCSLEPTRSGVRCVPH